MSLAVDVKRVPDPPSPLAALRRAITWCALLALLLSGLTAVSSGAASAAPNLIPDGFNASVESLAVGADGTQYVGGSFTRWAPQTGGGAAVDTTSGQVNRSFPAMNGSVLAAADDGAGGFYVAGTFTAILGEARSNLGHINADGTLNPWNPGQVLSEGYSGYVDALAVSGSTVYIGGAFDTIGGITRNNVAEIDAGGTLTSWNPNADQNVNALLVSGPTVYVGGSFSSISGQGRNGLAAIGTDGTLTPWNPDLSDDEGARPSVQALALSGSTVYAGGSFAEVGDTTRNNLAAIDTDGTLTPWNPGPAGDSCGGSVYSLAVSGTTVYVGGYFTSIGGDTRNNLAAIDTGGTLTLWNPNVGGTGDCDQFVSSLAVSGSNVYVGGEFASIGGTPRNRLAAIDTDGTLTPWNPDPSGNSNSRGGMSVKSIAVAGSTAYVGGNFTSIGGGTVRNGLAAIGTDGSLTSWNPSANGTVINALAISGSSIYAAGCFSSFGDGCYRVVSLGTDCTVGPVSSALDENVDSLAVSGSTIYLGGGFTSIGGDARNNLAALGTDGSLKPWNPDAGGQDRDVSALTVSGSTVYVGGKFSTIGGIARNNLAAIGTDGSLKPWDPNVTGDPDTSVFVNAVEISESTVYIGGSFTAVGGDTRNNLAAIGTDGEPLPWNPNVDTGEFGSVSDVTVNDATVYVVGGFDRVGGVDRNNAAAVGTDGTLRSWDPDADNSVNVIAVRDSTAYLGGSFSALGTGGSAYYASTPAAAAVAPTVTSISPNSGPVAGGTGVTVTGTGFGSGATASLGGSECPVTGVTTPTSLTCSTTSHAPGAVNVVVTNPDLLSGTMANGFTYLPIPPGTPAQPTAVAGDGDATVSVTAGPGGTPVSFAVTASPGGVGCAVLVPASSCVVGGLTNGTAYMFTATATNAGGTSASSASSAAVTPTAAPPVPPVPPVPGNDQTPAGGCVKSGGTIPGSGVKTLMAPGCETNTDQRIGVRVLNVQPLPGTRGDVRFYSLVCQTKKQAKRGAFSTPTNTGYGKACKKGLLKIRTFGQKLKLTVVWEAPATGTYAAYKKTRTYTT